MTKDLKAYEKTIKKKHRIAWNPKYIEEFRTELNQTVFVPIVIKTFEKLGWEIIYQDINMVGAIREAGFLGSSVIENVSVAYEDGKIKVKSESGGSEIWDAGRNSKRVKLFIYAFQQIVSEFDRESLIALEEETERKNNWDDYEIPESLPQSIKRKTPQFYIPLIGGIMTALLLGYIAAFLSVKFIYIIGLFEFGTAFLMGLAFKYLIRLSNYTDDSKLHTLLIGMVILIFVSSQYFEYMIIIKESNLYSTDFLEYMKYRIESGVTIKSANLGTIGLIACWLFQLGFTYLFAILKLTSALIMYRLERIPREVTDFAYYHFLKEKTEQEVRAELTEKGWDKEEDQNAVFESIGAIYDIQEMNRV